MKNKLQKFFKSVLCVILSLAMLSVLTVNVFAEAEASKTEYIKDVKLIYAESLSEAKKNVPEGYKLLDSDLNKGSGSDNKVYFVYSTTSNPDEAITDIKMMNMKGGFVLSDYEEQLKNVNEKVKKLANNVKISAEKFADNYVKGTYGAKAAYHSLSAFTVDEADGMTLADYIIYKKPTEEFYIKLVLNVHQNILSAVISALTMAVQGEIGDTWLDRLAKLEDPEVDEEPTYWDDGEVLWEHFYGFYQTYNTIDHSLYKGGDPSSAPKDGEKGEEEPSTMPPVDPETQPDIDYNGTEALYEVAYGVLQKYEFKNGETFSNWFLGDDVFDDEIIENFYALLSVMTPEEHAMMSLGGPLYMILATGMNEATYNDYVKRIDEVTGGATACSIWEGVNTELFHSSIGITDEAARKIAENQAERELNNQGDTTGEAGLKTAGLIAACSAVSLGLGIATYYAFGSLIYSCFGGAALTTAASVVSISAQIFMAVSVTLGIVALVVALVVAIVFLIVWINEIYDENHPVYTEIPEFMYDYVEDSVGNFQFVLYEGVRFQDGKVADVNTWEGKEWHAMYVSHDKAAGAPIEATDITVKYGDGTIDKGFAGLSNFGHINAQNLNAYDFDDDVDGVFVTYRQEDLNGAYAVKNYLSDAKLFSGDKDDAEKVALELKNKGYIRYDKNLTPNSDYVTYLGYKTTNNQSRALTDMRFAYGYNSQQYSTGGSGSSYASSGSTGDGMLTLYITRISLFGTPIRSNFLVLNDRNAPAGYEPVNLFTGGPAVNLNLEDGRYIDEESPIYLYFLPTKTYTKGTEYLGGLTMIYDQATKEGDNGAGSIENASKDLGYTILYKTKSKNTLEGALVYTTTYNPYRAIYGITAVKESEAMGHNFSKIINYDGLGYSLVDRLIVNVDGKNGYEYYTDTTADGRLYTAGVYQGGKAMKVSDLYVSAVQTDTPEGFYPVSARLSDDNRAVNLATGFYRRFQNYHAGGQPTIFSFDPFYLFVKGEGYKEGNYLTDIYLASKENIINSTGNSDLECDNIDNAYVMDQLSSLGAHTVILQNLNLADSDNLTYLGFTKRPKNKNSTELIKPITNIILYYAGDTDAKPESEMEFGKIKYQLAGDMNLFCEEEGTDEVCERVYLYYTTNPAAGSSIIDIKIDNTAILNGWETARTQNGKALYDDMDDYESNMWFIHMKRTTEDPKYIAEIVIGVGGSEADAKAQLLAAGCDYMLEKDFNNNVGAHSDYVFLGYKRTSNPNEAIRDLRTTHDDEVDSFVKNGATYYKIDGNLNSYTNIFADDIFLYYTKDAKAGTPITSLGTSGSVANWSHGEGNRYVVTTVLNQKDKASDLNDGAGGDYIYLLITRDRQDAKGIASMMGNGSVIIIGAFALVSAVAIAWICIAQKKKRRMAATVSAEITVDTIAEEAAQNDESV